MAAFTINIPIREVDATDVKNAFAISYGYNDTVEVGGVSVPNPLTKEEFVKQKCISFMLEITKSYLVGVEEAAAKKIAEELAALRAVEVTQWFDNRRLTAIGGEQVFQNFPSVNNLSLTTNKNQSVNFTLTGTDPDNLPLNFTIVTNPNHGNVLGSSPNFTYLPNNRYFGTDVFTVKANNGNKFSLGKQINVSIARAITAVDQTINVRKNQSYQIILEAHDGIAPIDFSISQQPANGQLVQTNSEVIYTPDQNYLGSDEFEFYANDETLQSNTGLVSINVVDIVAVDQILNVSMNNIYTFFLTSENGIGVPTYTIVEQPAHGQISIGSEYTYAPNSDFTGTDNIKFTATDGLGTSEIGTITFLVS
jgi:hypothetical protein